jgi:ParB family transcriptional regulator, chromosome partitioning protein
MAKKRVTLGRGLDKLLGNSAALTAVPVGEPEHQLHKVQYLSIESIAPGKYQPRKDMNLQALDELASSIRSQGLLQPIVVRRTDHHHFEIIAGERRWRAAQIVGMPEIPAIVRDINDQTAMALALIENLQREDLNPIEEASAIQRLIDECDVTHQEVAEMLGVPRASITNLLRLMGLHAEVKQLLAQDKLGMGHAKVLLALKDKQQVKCARIVAEKGLSVRETEALVRREQAKGDDLYSKIFQQTPVDPDIKRLQMRLSEKLGALVDIQHTHKGKGKLVIQYNSLDELDGILQHFEES